MSDVFHSLGYDQLRYNIHQTGREVDIMGTHCTENRIIIAECKAETAPIGGSDLNKFYGVLDAERTRSKLPAEGYFASISGFRESGIQQEKDLGGRFTLLNAKDIVSHLIRGRIVVDQKDAISEASKWLGAESMVKVAELELLAHAVGWHWLIKFANPGYAVSGYSVVHADGYVLEKTQAHEIVNSISTLTKLEYFGPATQKHDQEIEEARSRYREYLVKEYGYITLEGLPADQEVGSRSLRLETIFVPLSLERIRADVASQDTQQSESDVSNELEDPESDEFDVAPTEGASTKAPREPVGKVLAGNNRLALLGSPGAGKTTLLKRLAVAYAAPGRRTAGKDQLPARDWFPIVIRCRHLGTDVSRPLLAGIENLAERAEMPELGQVFREGVMHELRAGRVLLLVDGLDEIASPADRSAFVSQLRTFLGTYPTASLIVTSREYGFRVVASAVASVCTTYRVAELSDDDVRTMTMAWHREIVGPSVAVRRSAAALADSILKTDRVRRLAVNPLLLTTLLLVRRWLGELPRKRSVLYAKAIEVLLMTWNVEGHQPLDPDEALPQLAFAAFCMMQKNVQVVSIKELIGYFSEARRQMPELLGYSRMSVSEFVGRVEERSSLLSLSGHILEDGQLRATYEFKHLTFQEYLAALAAAQGYYPNRQENERLVDVLAPYMSRTSWREVVPLAGVLGGRSSGALIERIIEEIGPPIDFETLVAPDFVRDKRAQRNKRANKRAREEYLANLLSRCLIDDVPLAPDTLNRAINVVLTQTRHTPVAELLGSRYATEIYHVARAKFAQFDEFAMLYGGILAQSYTLAGHRFGEDLSGFYESFTKLISSPDPVERAEGCLWAMYVAFMYRDRREQVKGKPVVPGASMFVKIRTQICKLLENESSPIVLAAGFWALCWLVEIAKPTAIQTTQLLSHLWEVWQDSQNKMLQRQCAWTIWRLPHLTREQVSLRFEDSSAGFLKEQLLEEGWSKEDRCRAALTIGYYLGAPWTDEELIGMVRSAAEGLHLKRDQRFMRQLIASLGSQL
jgi:hypothetical protein